MIPHISLSRAYCATLIALIHPIALPMTCFFPMTLFFLSRFSWHIYHPNLFLGLRRRGGNRRWCCGRSCRRLSCRSCGGCSYRLAVGAGVGLAALPEGLLLEVLELLGFAVAAGFGVGLTVLLLSAFDAEDVLLGFELSVLVSGFAVGLAVAVGFVLAAGLLLNAALLSFSATALLVLLAAELSVSVFSATLFPVHPAKDAMSTAAIRIAVSFFFM